MDAPTTTATTSASSTTPIISALQRGAKLAALKTSLQHFENDSFFQAQETQFYQFLSRTLNMSHDINHAANDDLVAVALELDNLAITEDFIIANANDTSIQLSGSQRIVIPATLDSVTHLAGEISLLNIPGVLLYSRTNDVALLLIRDLTYPLVTARFCLDDGSLSCPRYPLWLDIATIAGTLPLFDWSAMRASPHVAHQLLQTCLHPKAKLLVTSDPPTVLVTMKRTRRATKPKRIAQLDSVSQRRAISEYAAMLSVTTLFPDPPVTWEHLDCMLPTLLDTTKFRLFKNLLVLDGAIHQYAQWQWLPARTKFTPAQTAARYQAALKLMELDTPALHLDAPGNEMSSSTTSIEDHFIEQCYDDRAQLPGQMNVLQAMKLLAPSTKWGDTYPIIPACHDFSASTAPIGYTSAQGRLPPELWFYRTSDDTPPCQALPIAQITTHPGFYRYVWLFSITKRFLPQSKCAFCFTEFRLSRLYVLARLLALKTKNGLGLGVCTECAHPFAEIPAGLMLPPRCQQAAKTYDSSSADRMNILELEQVVDLLFEGDGGSRDSSSGGDSFPVVNAWQDLDDRNFDCDLALMIVWALERALPRRSTEEFFRNLMKSPFLVRRLRNLKKTSLLPSLMDTFTRYESLLHQQQQVVHSAKVEIVTPAKSEEPTSRVLAGFNTTTSREDQLTLQSAEGQRRVRELHQSVPMYFPKHMQLGVLNKALRLQSDDKVASAAIRTMQSLEWIVLLDIVEFDAKDLPAVNEYRARVVAQVQQDGVFMEKYGKLVSNSLKSKKVRRLAAVFETHQRKGTPVSKKQLLDGVQPPQKKSKR